MPGLIEVTVLTLAEIGCRTQSTHDGSSPIGPSYASATHAADVTDAADAANATHANVKPQRSYSKPRWCADWVKLTMPYTNAKVIYRVFRLDKRIV